MAKTVTNSTYAHSYYRSIAHPEALYLQVVYGASFFPPWPQSLGNWTELSQTTFEMSIPLGAILR